MRKKRVSKIIVGVCLLLLLALALPLAIACAPKAAEQQVIKIGVILDFQGAVAEFGAFNEQGMRFKLNEIGHQVAGKRVEIIVEDGQGEPAPAVDKARKLVEQDGVVIMIGPVMTHAAAAVQQYLKPFGIPYFSILDWTPELLEQGTVFMTAGTGDAYSYVLGYHAGTQLGYKKAAVLYPDYNWGQAQFAGFRDGFTAQGGEIVQTFPTDIFSLDFAPYFSSLKDEVDVLAFVCFAGNMPIFMRQYKEFGVKTPLMLLKGSVISTEVMSPEMVADVGQDMQGILTAEAYSSYIDTGTNQDFVARFESKYGQRPELNAMMGYASLTAALETIEKTNGDTSPDKLMAAAKGLKVELPHGNIEYSENGMGILDIYIMRAEMRDGAFAWIPVQKYEQVNTYILHEKFD